MNILIISHAAGTPEVGPNTRTYALAKEFVRKGHQVQVVGSAYFHKYREAPAITGEKEKIVDGITYRWLNAVVYPKRNYMQVVNQFHFAISLLLWGLTRKQQQTDLIIFSSPPPISAIVAIFMARRWKCKLIVDVRDLWPEIIQELGGFGNGHPYIRAVRWSIKKAYSSSNAIVSVKPGDVAFIKKKYNPEALCRYIPNGFDTTSPPSEFFDIKAKTNTLKIVYVGALSAYYELESFLEAASLLGADRYEFFIVGDGEDRAILQRRAEELKCANIHFLGFLPRKYVISILEQCDVAFLGLKDTMANRNGISTNKLYEYMYAKLPILASYRTDYDPLQEANCGITIASQNKTEIKNVLEQFNSMGEKDRREMGQRGYNYLQKHHTFNMIANDYIELIQEL